MIQDRLQADVLIVGGGFAGVSCLRSVDRRHRRVALLSSRRTTASPSGSIGHARRACR